jgi:hypothetical protein
VRPIKTTDTKEVNKLSVLLAVGRSLSQAGRRIAVTGMELAEINPRLVLELAEVNQALLKICSRVAHDAEELSLALKISPPGSLKPLLDEIDSLIRDIEGTVAKG